MAGYKLSLAAEAKLAEIYEYSLLTFGERQADKYYLSLHDTFDLLVQTPLMGGAFTISAATITQTTQYFTGPCRTEFSSVRFITTVKTSKKS